MTKEIKILKQDVKGYKGFYKPTNKEKGDLQCRDFHFKIGETHLHRKKAFGLCMGGFHFCTDLKNVNTFYKFLPYSGMILNDNIIICEVIAPKGSYYQRDKQKSCSSKLKVVRKLTDSEIWKKLNVKLTQVQNKEVYVTLKQFGDSFYLHKVYEDSALKVEIANEYHIIVYKGVRFSFKPRKENLKKYQQAEKDKAVFKVRANVDAINSSGGSLPRRGTVTLLSSLKHHPQTSSTAKKSYSGMTIRVR